MYITDKKTEEFIISLHRHKIFKIFQVLADKAQKVVWLGALKSSFGSCPGTGTRAALLSYLVTLIELASNDCQCSLRTLLCSIHNLEKQPTN